MATLLISAAVNIAVGLLINALFPPPDIEQEGPRLTELGFTSAAYGKMVNIVFGTDRIAGNIIDTTDPAIEEVVNKESQSGKGGGQTVNTTTFTYFLTCRIAWCIEGATDIIRWWGDGKIIFDATGTTQLLKEGVTMTFYPGGINQLQDSEEVQRRDSDIPAYGHLTTIKVDRMPLADFGNRIPNFTAEIAFNSSVSTPVFNMVEPAGISVPGSGTGDVSYMLLNPNRNEVYSMKEEVGGLWAASVSDLTFNSFIDASTGNLNGTGPTVGRDGFAYRSVGSSNGGPLRKLDVETGATLGQFGGTGNLSDSVTGFRNTAGAWYELQTTILGVGVKSVVFHFNLTSGSSNGAVVDPDLIPLPSGFTTPVIHVFSTTDGLPSNVFDGPGIPDHDRGRFFIFTVNTANDSYDLFKVVPNFSSGISGTIEVTSVTITTVKQFTRGTFAAGDDFEGTGSLQGWALNRGNGDLMLSNNSCIVLYNPDTNTILAQEIQTGMQGRNNYYNGSIFAYGISSLTNGEIRTIDTRTLKTTQSVLTDDIPWPSGVDGVIHEQSCIWDDRVSALILSRNDSGSTAATDFRILKVFVNRLSSLGVGLDSVVSAISTSYQRQTMAGLDAADIDVTTLTGDTVQGYTLNRQSTMKSALQPLRDRFMFDAHQSDWIIKFPKRGATPTVTIPEDDVGILKRGRDLTDEPAVREVRQDDLSLPMSLAVRYRNKDIDYQVDIERDKRHLFPNPTMRSKSERTLDIPLVEQATAMKQLAQKTLLTLWNERVSYKTIVPWTYIALDSTDVFNMIVFNETHQLRMAENDLGQGWAIDLTGVVEDTKSFSSTLSGGSALGHINITIPSSLPTRLFPMNAPLLSLEDLLITPISNAYMGVGAFETGWPGATVMKSQDAVGYTPTGTVSVEAAIARVRTAPGAWNYVEGDFPNRFQEVADGGTLVITPLRRADIWASAADEVAVLNGANVLAVIKASDNKVEILQFQNATLNDDNTVTLTKLLRGRLGTEDVADAGFSASDSIVLLSDEIGVKEDASIIKQSIPTSELNTVLFFKGVTIGTLIEDAPVISTTYTGRDIQPYSVVHTTAVNTAGDIIVDWERRVRGPGAGEWLDGTDEVVLNETLERYTVIITDGVDTITRTVDDATTTTFTAADLSTASISGAVTVTVEQHSGITNFKSPITPSATATATV